MIKNLLVLDTSFSYEMIIIRGLQNTVLSRDLDGYFKHVWSVHPFASLVSSDDFGNKYGLPNVYQLSDKHTFIDGKIGLFKFLSYFKKFNFILSQIILFFYLFLLIKQNKINLIRTGDPLYIGVFAFLLSKFANIPYLVRIGANYEKIRINTKRNILPTVFNSFDIERAVEKFVISRADFIAAANTDNLNYALNFGAKKETSTLFRYGNLIDPLHFTEPSSRMSNKDILDIQKRGKFILCISRLEVVKKVEDVLIVTSLLMNQGLSISAVIVGDGSERQNLEKLAISLGIKDLVFFVGNKNQDWIANIIPKAAVVLSPHTGRALTEVALGGAPVVAYDIDWQYELIENGVTGELVSYSDVHQFSRSTLKILNDSIYAKHISNNLRVRTLEMMDPYTLNLHEITIYNNLI